jgi:hypothetical protein
MNILHAAKQFTVHRQGVDMEIVELVTKGDARQSPASQ